jgi:peptidoglycan hydrolase-like protein with peptidoglycan-binding domain
MYTFNYDMKVGSQSADVAALQNWLMVNGYDIPALQNSAVARGYFGAQTKLAVIKFQIASQLPGTGFVGPLTRARLNLRQDTTDFSIKVTSPNGSES